MWLLERGTLIPGSGCEHPGIVWSGPTDSRVGRNRFIYSWRLVGVQRALSSATYRSKLYSICDSPDDPVHRNDVRGEKGGADHFNICYMRTSRVRC